VKVKADYPESFETVVTTIVFVLT